MLTPNYALKASIDETIENVMRELRSQALAARDLASACGKRQGKRVRFRQARAASG